MNKQMFLSTLAVICLALLAATGSAQTCGPITSSGNPFPCSNGGNCTFFAAYKANTVWGINFNSLPSRRSAKYWADDAVANGYPVSSVPGIYTIGVSSTLSSDGHVAWVVEVSGSQVKVQEMNWGTYGWREKWYSVSTFNKGFIYPKQNSGQPSIWYTTPWTLWASSYNQSVGVIGWNLYYPLVFEATFPSGGRATLKDGQILYNPYLAYSVGCYSCQSVYLQATLNARGWWNIRAVASNGQRSDPYWFYVQ